jgi:hypothetical protein
VVFCLQIHWPHSASVQSWGWVMAPPTARAGDGDEIAGVTTTIKDLVGNANIIELEMTNRLLVGGVDYRVLDNNLRQGSAPSSSAISAGQLLRILTTLFRRKPNVCCITTAWKEID